MQTVFFFSYTSSGQSSSLSLDVSFSEVSLPIAFVAAFLFSSNSAYTAVSWVDKSAASLLKGDTEKQFKFCFPYILSPGTWTWDIRKTKFDLLGFLWITL